MQKWNVTYVDDHGEPNVEVFECVGPPSHEEAAKLIRARLFPALDALPLNDLEGRTDDPTLKSLKEQNSIEIISVLPTSPG
ncbi:hypothetical protein [Pseudomonas sp. Irchel 3E20]|uniref:hypothetical protein n=1 Tax=Pseudomonas sp. Irchel 3E20 TaxID=2008983 RepID=UPI000BA35800|nr:hypothetical protein [Pseudomonas sp. Irchel 3E20]